MKLHITCTLFFAAIIASAQDARLLLGGNLNYGSVFRTLPAQNESNINDLNFSAYIGIPLGKDWMMAAKGGWSGYDRNGKIGNTATPFNFSNRTYTLGLFARRYFRTEKPLRFYLEPTTTYSTFKNEAPGSSSFTTIVDKSRTIYAGISPGVYWQFSKRFGLIGQLGKLGFTAYKRRIQGFSDYTHHHVFQSQMNIETLTVGLELIL